METIETPREKIETGDEISPKMLRIIDGPPSDNYEFRQMQLIAEKCRRDNPGVSLTKKLLEESATQWADLDNPNSSYSRKWRDLAHHADFATSRFKGNYANVTLDDLEEFIRTGVLPK